MRNYRTLLLRLYTSIFLIGLFVVISVNAHAQVIIPVELSLNKAVHLFFTTPVKYCDVGSGEVSFKSNDNIITLTATKADFAETNLTVVTNDNLCYSFLLLYSSVPRQLNLNPDPKKAKQLKSFVTPSKTPEPAKPNVKVPSKAIELTHDSIIYRRCRKIISMDPAYQEIAVVQKQTGLMLSNVFVDDSCIYIAFYIINHSKKVFAQSFINFQIVELKGLLETKMRGPVKKPVFIYNKKETFAPLKTELMVYVFNKFVVEEGKKLCLEIGERDGDRLLSINISDIIINKAAPIK